MCKSHPLPRDAIDTLQSLSLQHEAVWALVDGALVSTKTLADVQAMARGMLSAGNVGGGRGVLVVTPPRIV